MKLTEALHDLGRPAAYYPRLTPITGGVSETLFLCQLIYWHGRQEDPDGWIYKTQPELEAETGLSRREQETARRNLKSRGFLQETKKTSPPVLHYRVDFEALNGAWESHLNLAESAKLDCAKAPNQNGANAHLLNEETETTTETTPEKNLGTQDLLFESVAEVCGIDWRNGLTDSARAPLNRAVKELRAVNATPDDVRWHAANWPYDATLTPMALAKHWPQLHHPHKRAGPRDRFVDMARQLANEGRDDGSTGVQANSGAARRELPAG